jgi:TubC N-terminal docking domain
MTAKEIVENLEKRGVVLWIEGDRVHFEDPHEVVTPAVLQVLRQGKTAIMKVVENYPRPHPNLASAWVADLVEAGRLADLENDVFQAMDYTPGGDKLGPWVPEVEILRRMPRADPDELREVLLCLESFGRVEAHRRYMSTPLWRVLLPKDAPFPHNPGADLFASTSGPDWTSWD